LSSPSLLKHWFLTVAIALLLSAVFICMSVDLGSLSLLKLLASDVRMATQPQDLGKLDIGSVISPNNPADRSKTIITENKKLKMTVIAGIKGYHHPQKWIPVKFILENYGPSVNGYVEVIENNPAGNPRNIFRKRLDLAQGARKKAELTIMVDQPFFKARYVSRDKVLLQTTLSPRWVEPFANIIGVLTNEDSNMNFFKDITAITQNPQLVNSPQGSQLAVFNNPTELPESYLGLSSLDILIINGVSTAELSSAQKKAILDWVRDGGLLILGGGPGASKVISGLPSEAVPVEIGVNKTHQDLPSPLKLANNYEGKGTFIYTSIKSYQGDINLGNEEAPYIVGKDLGNGRVVWVAFDLSQRPFSEWRANDKFWEKITLGSNKYGLNVPYNVWHGALGELLFNIPALKAPSLTVVIAFLFLYLLIVSPLNYFILKKLDKREWAWVTIPIFIAIFGLSSYWYAYMTKGGDVIVNQLGILKAYPKEKSAKLYNAFGIFSPGKTSYIINMPEGISGLPMPGHYYGNPMTMFDPSIIDQDNKVTISNFNVASWTMRSFLTSGRIDFENKLAYNLSYVDGGIKGKIKNNFDYPLTDVFVVAGKHIMKVGTIQPGNEKEIKLKLNKPNFNQGPIGMQFFGRKRGNSKRIMVPETYSGTMLIKTEMLNLALGYEAENMPKSPTVIAWINKPIMVPDISGKKPIYRGQTMLMLPIDISSKDHFVIHPGQISYQLVNKIGRFRIDGPNFVISNGCADFEYSIPAKQKYTPLSTSLFMRQMGPPTMYKVYAYNFKKGEWIQVETKQGWVDLKPSQEYISPDNKAKARIEIISKNKREELYFRAPEFEVTGKWQ